MTRDAGTAGRGTPGPRRIFLAAEQGLTERLGSGGAALLERLEDAYLRRERAMALGAFTEGFLTAAGLALDIRKHLSGEGAEAAIYYNQEGLGEAPRGPSQHEGE